MPIKAKHASFWTIPNAAKSPLWPLAADWGQYPFFLNAQKSFYPKFEIWSNLKLFSFFFFNHLGVLCVRRGRLLPALDFAALTFSQKDSSVIGVCFCPTVMNASPNSANSVRGPGRGKKKLGQRQKEASRRGERTCRGSGANTRYCDLRHPSTSGHQHWNIMC